MKSKKCGSEIDSNLNAVDDNILPLFRLWTTFSDGLTLAESEVKNSGGGTMVMES